MADNGNDVDDGVDQEIINKLTSAAARAEYAKVFDILENSPTNIVNRTNKYGRTALQVMNSMCLDTANILLEHGADVNIRDPSVGRTPLHDIAETGHLEILNNLLLHGADPVARDKWGNTPAHLAAENGGPTREGVLEALGRVATLKEINKAEETPQDVARRKGHESICRWFDEFFD